MTRKLTELRNWVNAQDREVFDSVGNNLANLRSHDLQALEAYKEQVEKELKKIREENMKRQQAEEKMRKEFLKRQKGEEKTKEELWGVIRKMQAEIEELKKGQVRQSVERSQLERGTQANLQHVAAFEGELMSSHLEGSTSRENEVPKNYTSSALVPFSPQVDNNTSSHNNQGFGQFANSALVVSGLDLTTRPANRGSQSLTSVPGADREPSDPNFKAPVPAHKRLPRINYNNFPVVSDVRSRLMEEFPALWVGDDDDEDDAPTNKRRAPFGKESHTASGRPLGRLSQGTAAPSSASRSRSPRKSLNANFRVRDEGSEPTSTSKSRSSRQRSSSSSSVDSIPNENEQNLSSQSIPSRFQPSRRTKSANELIDKHLSFIPNGWRTIIANTAKQLSSEDWDKSDAKVLKKLEEHCPSFKGLEEILPNVKMAVPALRDLVRDLKKYC
ncbi:hypothetical protein B0T20DRAFT_418901 [Sordaria brevicollis]|uniref:Uncharacterized protein n=1 Tax=Sordaria brevicollis TaxID=83679 RepID=A0AAE0P936_SORBR|nr:hypothetical protein B0T20DRAFT_418901 [Sordaria brevicollis]